MDDNESDESLNTEDMNELVETKKVITGGVERSSPPKEKKSKIKKSKKDVLKDDEIVTENVIEENPKQKVKKPRTEKQIEATKKMLEANKKKKEDKIKELEDKKVEKVETKVLPSSVIEDKPKKKMGRPKTNFHTKEIIHKIQEKVIYMIPNEKTGEYEQMQNPKPLCKKDLKRIELEKQVKENEIELGKKLIRKKNGSADMRSKNKRTDKQIENSKKLVEYNRKKKADRLKLQKQELNETIKDNVEESMINVVTKPISQVKEERKLKRTIITEEERKAYEFNKTKSLFC